MAIDFNGTTSKLDHATANVEVTTEVTFCVSVFADGLGEFNLGTVVALNEQRDSLCLQHRNLANFLRLQSFGHATDGIWSFPATDSQWNHVAVSYDASSVLNDPVARVNFTNVTVTEVTTPVGAFTQPTTGYCVGNHSAQGSTWDGMIQHVQVFNVILTDREMDLACRRPGSVRRGLKLWLPMLHAGHVVDWSGNGLSGTATDLTDRVGGPAVSSLFASMEFPLFQEVGAAVPPQEWNVPPVFRPNRKRRVAVSGMRPAYN